MNPLRCAIYTRYSSERQNSLTIEQQIRKCREHAERQGWQVLLEHVYRDEAISGATDNRPSLQHLRAEARKKPCPFDAILVDDTSRLSRNLADSMRIVEEVRFAGVRVIYVAQGFDTSSEQAEPLVAMHGIVDSLYLKELAKKTFRGVEQRAIEGLHTGGRVFGYRRVPIENKGRLDSYGRPVIEGVRLEVEPGQAATVRRIFERYAAGHSFKRIALDLNGEGISSPQPQRGRVSQSWCPSSIRTILYNERYRGVGVWGKTVKLRSPETGKRVYRRRPEAEWRRTAVPEQRIVSDELWDAVRERLRQVKELYHVDATRPGLLRARAMGSPYIFTGLLKCSVCGANVTIVSGKWKNREDRRYGCPMHAYRGNSVCTNSLLVPRRILEARLLAGLQAKVLHPEVVSYTLTRFEQELMRALHARRNGQTVLRHRMAEIERQIQNCTDAIAGGLNSPSVSARIRELEEQRAEIEEKLAASEPKVLKWRVRETRRFVESRLRNLRTLLNADPLRVRAEISKHVSRITLTPQGHTYIASGTWDLLGSGCMDGAGGQNRTGYARLFRAALYQ